MSNKHFPTGRIFLFLICYPYFFSHPAFSQEEITITAYYPSPYGVYDELQTDKFMVGAGVMPDNDGVVNFQQLAANPVGAASNTEGAMYYNTTFDEFRYRNGTAWRSLGGPGICLRRTYTSVTGIQSCPAGYQLAGVVYDPSVALPAVGIYLCCIFCNDFDSDGNCDP